MYKNKIVWFEDFISDDKINIYFSGDGIITLSSESIEVVLHDLGKTWNVKHVPKHKI